MGGHQPEDQSLKKVSQVTVTTYVLLCWMEMDQESQPTDSSRRILSCWISVSVNERIIYIIDRFYNIQNCVPVKNGSVKVPYHWDNKAFFFFYNIQIQTFNFNSRFCFNKLVERDFSQDCQSAWGGVLNTECNFEDTRLLANGLEDGLLLA